MNKPDPMNRTLHNRSRRSTNSPILCERRGRSKPSRESPQRLCFESAADCERDQLPNSHANGYAVPITNSVFPERGIRQNSSELFL